MTAPLRALSFIHFARWALIERWPADRQTPRDRAAPRSMLFLTSFDGSDIQYIEAFVRVVPDAHQRALLGGEGLPGAEALRPGRAVHRRPQPPRRPLLDGLPGGLDDDGRAGAEAAGGLRRLRARA